MPRQPSWKNVCFTLNNPTESETKALQEAVARAGLRYIVYQKELGESKTPHFQGYAESTKQLNMEQWKSKLGSTRYHLERRMGTQAEARKYCMKEDTRMEGPWEFGTFLESEQGKRSDLEALAEAAIKGKRVRELLDDENLKPSTLLLHLSHFLKLRQYYEPERDHNQPVEVIVMTGATGTGKSKWARETYPGAYWVPAGKNLMWWDKYEYQETIVIDEFDWTQVEYRHLLKILDRYGPMVQTKGSHVTLHHNRVVLTTVMHPDEWYETLADTRELHRRILKIGVASKTVDASGQEQFSVHWILDKTNPSSTTTQTAAPAPSSSNFVELDD